jgi:hypothetical protein
MSTYQFHNRRPSKKQIIACIDNALKDGSKTIGIEWGENVIELQYFSENNKWGGRGNIGQVSGQDIAGELTRIEHYKTLNLWNS